MQRPAEGQKKPRNSEESRLGNRREAFLAAAESLFLEKGFERTRLSEIVRASGGSLATLYALFENKEGLVAEVVHRRLALSLTALLLPPVDEVQPAERLRKLAREIFDFTVSDIGRDMLRLLAATSLKDRRFGPRYHSEKRLPLIRILEKWFADWNNRGLARVGDPPEAARMFIAMALLDSPFEILLGVSSPPITHERIDRRIAPFLAWFRIAGAEIQDRRSLPG